MQRRPLGLCCLALSSAHALTPQKIILEYGETSRPQCLVRRSGFVEQQVIAIPCEDVFQYDVSAATWLQYPDGRIRGTNGLCLHFLEGDGLIAQKCWYTAAEKWKLDDKGRLSCPPLDDFRAAAAILKSQSTASKEVLSNAGKESDSWITEPVTLRQFGESRLADMYRAKLERQLDARRAEFRQLPDPDSDLSLLTVTEASLQAEQADLAAVLSEIDNLAAEFRVDLDGAPSRAGQGVIVKLSAIGSDDDVAFLSPTFAVTADQIRRNSQSSNPSLVTVSGYIICPKTGQYTFHAVNLTSSFRLQINGEQVIDQWNAPALGEVQTDKPMQFNEGDEILVTATSSGLMATPAFSVLWSETGGAPAAIPTDILYPNYARPICTSSSTDINRIDCQTTFDFLAELNGDTKITVDCPAGCLSSDLQLPAAEGKSHSYGVFGSPQCYSPDSRVCAAAIHSGVLGERGGSAVVKIDGNREKASYQGVQGFLIASDSAPAATGCAFVEMPVMESSVQGLKELQVLDSAELFAANAAMSAVAPFTSALPLSASGPVVTARRARGLGWLTAVDKFVCDRNGESVTSTAATSPIRFGSSQLVPVYATSKLDPVVNLIFGTSDGPGERPMLTHPALHRLNRLSCVAKDGRRWSVFFRHAEPIQELDYPSRTVSCETTFQELASPLSSFSVRCHRHCAAAAHPVYGAFVYGGLSSVCRSAYHAGVIAEAGGVVRVDRLPGQKKITWSSKRNGITSSKFDTEPTDLYFVDRAYGRRCIYPQHPPHIITHTLVNRVAADQSGAVQPTISGTVDVDTSDTIDSRFRQTNAANIRPHAPEWEPRFVQLSTTFDLSDFMNGRAAGLDTLDKDLQKSAASVADQEAALSKAREITRSLNVAAVERLREFESQIGLLESEYAQSLAESNSEPYTKLCGSRSLYEDWLTVDTVDSVDGPSSWSFHGENCSISQRSAISSSTSSVGSVMLLRDHSYDVGFIVGRVYVPEGVSGRFGFIAKMQSEADFVAAVVELPPQGEGDLSLSITRCAPIAGIVTDNSSPLVCQRGLNTVTAADVAPAGWLDLAVDFSRDSVRAFINRGAMKTGAEMKEPLGPGGSIGVFTDGLRGSRVGSPLVQFSNLKAGPIAVVGTLVRNSFPKDAETDLVVQTARPARVVEVDPLVASTVDHSEGLAAVATTTISLGAEGCVNNVTDTFEQVSGSSGDTSLWLTEGSWFAASLSSVKALSSNGGAASKTLVPPVCPPAKGVSLSVNLAVSTESEGGLLVRSAAPTSSLAVTLSMPPAESRSGGPNVRLVAQRGTKQTVYSSSAVEQVLPETWHSLEVRDFFNSVQVLLDGHVVLQQLIPADNSIAPRRGLAAPTGTAYFRDFQLKLI